MKTSNTHQLVKLVRFRQTGGYICIECGVFNIDSTRLCKPQKVGS